MGFSQQSQSAEHVLAAWLRVRGVCGVGCVCVYISGVFLCASPFFEEPPLPPGAFTRQNRNTVRLSEQAPRPSGSRHDSPGNEAL